MDAILFTLAAILLAVIIGLGLLFIIGTFIWAFIATIKAQPAPLDEDHDN